MHGRNNENQIMDFQDRPLDLPNLLQPNRIEYWSCASLGTRHFSDPPWQATKHAANNHQHANNLRSDVSGGRLERQRRDQGADQGNAEG